MKTKQKNLDPMTELAAKIAVMQEGKVNLNVAQVSGVLNCLTILAMVDFLGVVVPLAQNVMKKRSQSLTKVFKIPQKKTSNGKK